MDIVISDCKTKDFKNICLMVKNQKINIIKMELYKGNRMRGKPSIIKILNDQISKNKLAFYLNCNILIKKKQN
jgi:hypothetical protein